MSRDDSFELAWVDRLTAGTIGPPGQRIFFLQARQGDFLLSLKLEKVQVEALARYLMVMLTDLPEVGELPDDTGLDEPVAAAWTVGNLGVSYDKSTDKVVILAEELVDEGEEAALARITATREQVAALAWHGSQLVKAGRPTCRLCGHPMDPHGHACVRSNGQHPPTP